MQLTSLFRAQIPSALLILLLAACTGEKQATPTVDTQAVPAWSETAIWYQIFVERFRNGDPNNDPTPADMAGGDPAYIPSNWQVTPWGQDWYKRDPWYDSCRVEGFYHRIQLRRYGGDLQGVIDKLDYLQELGITAVYFNPLNDAPSLHKYDARHWRHIDRNFGPDPVGDVAIMAAEVPDDPASWQWTAADKLFLEVIRALHERGIRVVLDYSWNHTSPTFWALDDIRRNGEKSAYLDWFNILRFDDPATPENEMDWEGWAGYKGMPVVQKDIGDATYEQMPLEGNLVSEALKQHIFQVSARWLDPNGDGDPSDGVDGFRLDVAGEIPMDFWREYKTFVKGINPEAYLVGEIWWLHWPDSFLDPQPYLGDQFDAVMNYRWYQAARSLFGQGGPIYTPSRFREAIAAINAGIAPQHLRAMMNVAASHDSPRLSTSLFNKNKYKYKAKPADDATYLTTKPDTATRRLQELLLIHQFTYPGAPHIWNGDELGMWGADDPDCRKPLWWDDITFEPEQTDFFGNQAATPTPVSPDLGLLEYYRRLIRLRKENTALSLGDFQIVTAQDEPALLAYTRTLNDTTMLIVFNLSDQWASVTWEDLDAGNAGLLYQWPDAGNNPSFGQLPPESVQIWKWER